MSKVKPPIDWMKAGVKNVEPQVSWYYCRNVNQSAIFRTYENKFN